MDLTEYHAIKQIPLMTGAVDIFYEYFRFIDKLVRV